MFLKRDIFLAIRYLPILILLPLFITIKLLKYAVIFYAINLTFLENSFQKSKHTRAYLMNLQIHLIEIRIIPNLLA